MVRTLACHARGRGFESLPDRHFFALVAQMVEQGTENPRVGGSIPPQGTNAGLAQLAEQLICNQQVVGSIPIAGSRWDKRSIYMGRFQSGQMEQTVNLPEVPSVVRIHPCPPRNNQGLLGYFFLYKPWLNDIQCSALMIFSHIVSDDIHFLRKWLNLQVFLFLVVKYKSFTLYPLHSIYGVSFNCWFAEVTPCF